MQIGARVTVFVINLPSDFKVSLHLINILHCCDALRLIMCFYEVGRTGVYYPDLGDRDTDGGSGP